MTSLGLGCIDIQGLTASPASAVILCICGSLVTEWESLDFFEHF